jgi:tight adherence protein C
MPQMTSIIIDLVAFAIVAVIVFVLSRRVEANATVRRRLSDEVKKVAKATPTTPLVRNQDVKNPVLAWVQKTTLQDPGERQTLKSDLANAGFESQAAPAIYVMMRFILAVTLPTMFVWGQGLFLKHPITGLKFILIPFGLAAVGLIMPRAFIDNRAGARRQQIMYEFPDMLDLMVVCVESGLGLEGAILRVGEETRESHPRTSGEFEIISNQLRAGRTRVDALRAFATRTQVEMVKSFVALLIQTDALGGSIATSLRTYSAEMREHRMLKAEEKAMRLPVLLTVPLVFFILPVIFTAVLLPAVISVMRNFQPAVGG